MAFQLSPGVLVKEIDLTAIVPAVSTTAGGFAGYFLWGPVDEIITVESEGTLAASFQKPNNDTFKSFFTAANFLAYGNNLQVVRSVDQSVARNAVARPDGGLLSVAVTESGAGYTTAVRNNTIAEVIISGAVQPTTNANIIINYTGEGISSFTVDGAGAGYTSAVIANASFAVTTTGASTPGTVAEGTPTYYSTSGVIIRNEDHYEQSYSTGQGSVGEWAAKYPGTYGSNIIVSIADGNTFSSWAYSSSFDGAPGTSAYASQFNGSHDEVHVVLIDETGKWTGTPGQVLEKFSYASKASDAKNADGSSAYYKNVINDQSKYIWWMDHAPGATNWGSAAQGVAFANLTSNVTLTLAGGVDGPPTAGNIQTSFNLFSNDEAVDVSLLLSGDATQPTVESLITIAEARKDCIVFISPEQSDVVNQLGSEVTNAIEFRDTLTSSSYAVMDSGYKYQYDRYNDVYRWIPLNGDVAGLCVRTDFVADPWFSPAGFNRGQIRNVVKLAYSPNKTERDNLYKKGINPVVSFPGQGTILFGDKTLLAKPSAFDRINVRRLFIVLEKAIATASKYQLFEFNDAFTRAQFRNLVEPFLRDVQGRRGLTDFKVVCDETNNTGEIIDRNEFVADIFIKPNRSINFIQLNFIATRSGISFEEVGA